MTAPDPSATPRHPEDAVFLAAIAAQIRADRAAPASVKAMADAAIEIAGEHGAHALIVASVDYITTMVVTWAALDPGQRDAIHDVASRAFAFGFNKVESRKLGFGRPNLTVIEGDRT